MYWNSVSTYEAHLHFQYPSGDEIVYFSRGFSTTFIQFIQHTEVTSNQLKSFRCFHCARLESLYWNSVYTFGALLQFQYHSCEEIVYFSRDFSTIIICIHHNEVTSGQHVLSRCFHCARLESMFWISVYSFGALLHISVPQLWRDSLLFNGLFELLSFNTSNIPKSHRGNQLKL